MTQTTKTEDGAVEAPRPAEDGGLLGGRRRLLLSALAGLLVAGLVALALVLTGGDRGAAADDAAGATSSSPAPSDSVAPNPPTPTPTGPTEDATELPAALPEVPLDSPAAVGNGVVATVSEIEGIQGSATGPGNIAGPAIRVTLHVENGTAEPIALAGAAVNLYHGPERTPASPLDDPSQRPFGVDPVQAGDSADGTYVFTVPADARDSITVELGYQAGAPLLLFTGAVR